MKKFFLSLIAFVVIFAGCSQKSTEKIPVTTSEDSLAQAIGALLASDAVYSDLVEYSPMIDEAVNDIYYGNVNKIHEVYAYINAIEILNKAYNELSHDLNKEIVLQSAHELLTKAKDSLDFEGIHIYEQSAQNYVMGYVNKLMSSTHKEFLANVDKIEGIQKSESGLRYIVDNQGSKIGEKDKVKVKYVLYDYLNNIIDQSKDKPFEFQLPSGVVPGFAESVMIAGYGGKIRSWVPANLAYGDAGNADIAPGQTLVFEIEVLPN